MACCTCCCGGVDCTEGQQGKCCCGGSAGVCCQEGQYCCDGECLPSPCQIVQEIQVIGGQTVTECVTITFRIVCGPRVGNHEVNVRIISTSGGASGSPFVSPSPPFPIQLSGSSVTTTHDITFAISNGSEAWANQTPPHDTVEKIVLSAPSNLNTEEVAAETVNSPEVTVARSSHAGTFITQLDAVNEGQTYDYEFDFSSSPCVISGTASIVPDPSLTTWQGDATVTNQWVLDSAGRATVTVSVADDSIHDPGESFRIRLSYPIGGGSGVSGGYDGETYSHWIEIVDINTPTYSITPNSLSVIEGGNASFSVATTNIADGTTLTWQVTHVDTAPEDFAETSGSVTVQGNAASISIGILVDTANEPGEKFTVGLYSGGQLVATSVEVEILNSSSPCGPEQYVCEWSWNDDPAIYTWEFVTGECPEVGSGATCECPPPDYIPFEDGVTEYTLCDTSPLP